MTEESGGTVDLMAALEDSLAATKGRLRCRCLWDGSRCPNDATEEDGMCDWCGERPFGMGGGGQRHVNANVSPDACWIPGSGRTLTQLGRDHG